MPDPSLHLTRYGWLRQPPQAGEPKRQACGASLMTVSRTTHLRKLIVCNIISLDGFYSGLGGDVMVMPFDAGFPDYNAERLRAADTLLLGRTSYGGFRSYWPAVAEDMSQPPVEREISRLNAAIERRGTPSRADR